MLKGWLTKLSAAGLFVVGIAKMWKPEYSTLWDALITIFTGGAAWGIRRNMPDKKVE